MMRTLLVTAMLIGAIPHGLTAQRGGGGAHGGGGAAHPGFGSGFGFGFGKGAGTGGRFGFGNGRFGFGFGNGWGRGGSNRNGFSGGFSGGGYGDAGWDEPFFSDSGSPGAYGDGNQFHPGAVLLMPPAAPPPPPQPAHPVIREYSWPADGGDAHATFSIVPKNGQVRQAVAVWVQDNEVRYTDPAGRGGRMPPNTVDCSATDQLNAQKNLRLALPGCGVSR